MASDEEDSEDLYDDEFDFVDDDDEDELDADDDASDLDSEREGDSELERKPAPREAVAKNEPSSDDRGERQPDADIDADEEIVDDLGRPKPEANYVVHIYEHRDFKRTIDRPFIPEDAEAFASEYNRTAKPYGRFAVAGKNDAKPRKTLD